jgi:membrane fusion protein (multidrug efflux system)
VEWIGAEEGASVEAGAELLRVDTESLRARLDEAQAQLTLARQEFERARRLAQRGVSSERELDSAQASLDVAQANVRVLAIQLEKSVIAAPIAGVVDTVFVDENEFVDMGSPLVRMVQVDRLKVEVGVPERDVVFFETGDTVRVRFDALRGEEHSGRIHRIATTADPVTHTFTTEVALDNPGGRARPGMIARLTLVRETYEDAVVAPVFSTFLLEDQRYAFVVEDGVARLREVKTGQVLGGRVVVTQGLSEGDHLIVRGQYQVRDGDVVTVIGPSAPEADGLPAG